MKIHKASHRRAKSDHNEHVLLNKEQTQNWQKLSYSLKNKQINTGTCDTLFHTFTYIPVTKLASSAKKKISPQTHDAVFYPSFSVWIISRIIPNMIQNTNLGINSSGNVGII